MAAATETASTAEDLASFDSDESPTKTATEDPSRLHEGGRVLRAAIVSGLQNIMCVLIKETFA